MLFQLSSDGIVISEVCRDGSCATALEANEAFGRLLGYPAEEILHIGLIGMAEPQDRAVMAHEMRTLEEGKVLVSQRTLVAKDGRPLPLEIRSRKFRRRGRQILVSVIRDLSDRATVIGHHVTGRKRAEEALRQSETRLRLAQVSANAGVWDWDVSSGKLDWSKELFLLFGLDPEKGEASFEAWRSTLHPEDRQGAEERIQWAVANRTPLTSEYRIVLPSGEVRWINALGNTTYDKTGQAVRMLGICVDITERKRTDQALAASQDEYRHLVEASGSVIIRSDKDMNIRFMNRYGLEFFGYTAEELMGRNALGTIIPERDKAGHDLTEMAGDLMRRPDQYTTNVHQNRRKDGSLVWMSWANKAIYDEQGELLEILAIGNDLSRLKDAEEAAQESRAKLEAALASMTDAVSITDVDGRFLDFNDAFVAYHRFETREQCAKALSEHPDILDVSLPDGTLAPREMWAVPRALRGETASSAEYTLRRKDTGETWVGSYTFGPIRDKEGSIVGSVVVGRDITDQKRAEEALRRSEEERKIADAVHAERQRFFDMLETLPPMICLLTPDRQIAFANRSFREAFGDPGGRPCFESCFGRTEPCEYCQSYKVLETGRPHHWEQVTPDGKVIDTYDFPFTDVDGSPMVLKMDMDITERRRTEQALRCAHEDLAARAGQLRALAGELAMTEQRERRRMAKVLHDHLQQLLVGAKFRTVILGRAGDEITKQAASEIEHLLDESISVSRSLTAELSPPILHEGGLSAGLAWLARWMGDRHGLAVEMTIEEDLPEVAEDVRVLLFESVRELLFNAVKHAHVRSARVHLRQISGKQVQISVSDLGPGFDPGQVKKAGERGGGFGLFGVRERLDLVGGRMEIDSAPSRGTLITLVAPVAKAGKTDVSPSLVAGVAESADVEQIPRPAGLTKRKPGIRVLLADDHRVTREGLRRLLEEEPDILIVGEAADGQEAVELANTLSPDVILMDLSMPRLNGVEATRAIHNDYPDIRIIGLSMFEEAERAQALRDAGAVNYLTKSGPSSALIEAIRACMNCGG